MTTAGDVIQLRALSTQQHQLLSTLQHVMSKDAALATLSGCDLQQYRAANDGHAQKHPQAAGMSARLAAMPCYVLPGMYCCVTFLQGHVHIYCRVH